MTVSAIGALSPAQSEFDHRAMTGRLPDAGRFGGYKRLEVDVTEQDRLYDLALDKVAADLHQRFVWKNNRAFRYGSDVSAEAIGGKIALILP